MVLVQKNKRTIRAACQARLVPGQNSVKAVVTVSRLGIVIWLNSVEGGRGGRGAVIAQERLPRKCNMVQCAVGHTGPRLQRSSWAINN